MTGPGFASPAARGQPKHFGEIGERLLRAWGKGQLVHVARLEQLWPEIVGERLAALSRPSIEGSVLVVEAEDGAVADRLRTMAHDLLNKVSAALETQDLKEARFRVRRRF